jgi:hypothetical protein
MNPILITILLAPTIAFAQPLPIKKFGNCPSGYRESGGYCAPMQRDAPVAIPKGKSQCPSGFMQSGSYCLEMRRPRDERR